MSISADCRALLHRRRALEVVGLPGPLALRHPRVRGGSGANRPEIGGRAAHHGGPDRSMQQCQSRSPPRRTRSKRSTGSPNGCSSAVTEPRSATVTRRTRETREVQRPRRRLRRALHRRRGLTRSTKPPPARPPRHPRRDRRAQPVHHQTRQTLATTPSPADDPTITFDGDHQLNPPPDPTHRP